METVKNFLIGLFTVAAILFLLLFFTLLRPVVIGLGAIIFGMGSIVLFFILSILTVIIIFYIITLIGLVVRKALTRPSENKIPGK